jgi:hypothetical protein
MSVIEAVVVISAVLNILLIVLVFLMYTSLISIKMQINQMHIGMSTMLSKLLMLENITSRIGTGFTEFIDATGDMLEKIEFMINGPSPRVYKTSDGKFVAGSVEELMNKIKGSDSAGDYFSDDEINKLRNLFEENDEDDDEDDTINPDQEYK